MAVVTINSDFGAQEKKVCHCFHFFPFDLLWSDGAGLLSLLHGACTFWLHQRPSQIFIPQALPPRFLSPQISVPHIPVHCSLTPSSSPMCPRAMLSMVFDHLCPVLWDKQMKAVESGSKLAIHQQEMPSPRPAPLTQVPHSALKGTGHPPHWRKGCSPSWSVSGAGGLRWPPSPLAWCRCPSAAGLQTPALGPAGERPGETDFGGPGSYLSRGTLLWKNNMFW